MHSSVPRASIAASTAGQPMASPNIHSTTAPLMVASVMSSPFDMGPMALRLAWARVGASGVSLTCWCVVCGGWGEGGGTGVGGWVGGVGFRLREEGGGGGQACDKGSVGGEGW